jgi:hypothetical protein
MRRVPKPGNWPRAPGCVRAGMRAPANSAPGGRARAAPGYA